MGIKFKQVQTRSLSVSVQESSGEHVTRTSSCGRTFFSLCVTEATQPWHLQELVAVPVREEAVKASISPQCRLSSSR